METSVSTRAEGKVARPLNVLVPLIKDDLNQGREAEKQAGIPYYTAAGGKLAEAKQQVSASELYSWAHRHFKIRESQVQLYIRLWEHTGKARAIARAPTSLDDFKRSLGHSRPTSGRVNREWGADVDNLAEKARASMERVERLHQDNMTRQQEREAERALALKLIDIGYKVLAKELHPDKMGGNRAAFQRLAIVRDRLRTHA